jgi:hypothetical protein
VGTEALVAIAAELATLQETLEQALDFIDKNLDIQDKDYDEILLDSKTNAVSIHFEPEDEDEMDDYASLLMGELAIHDLSPAGNLEQLRYHLKLSLKTEQMVCLHQATIEHMSETEGTLFFLMQAMPCILHMENHVGIKL